MGRTNAAVRMRAALLAAIAATLALAASTTARAATITVDSLDDTGAPGICVLRDAITAANTMKATNGCAAGTCNDTIVFSVTGTIQLVSTLPEVTSFLEIDGPGSPGRAPSTDITIDGGGKVRVMNVGGGAEVTLNHLIIAHGSAGRFGSAAKGGGILNDGTLTVSNSTVSNNGAGGVGGGGIFNNGTLTVSNSAVSGNGVNGEFGGGIWNNGTLTVTNSTVSNNFEFDKLQGGGGGIFNNRGATLTVTNSTVSNNGTEAELGNSGGGILDQGGKLTVTNSTVSGNSVDGGSGGGIVNNGMATVTNSTFSGNSAHLGSGGGIVNGGTLTVINSTFSGNIVHDDGGAIVNGGTLTVTNSTLSGNESFFALTVGEVSGGGTFKGTIVEGFDNGVNCGGRPTDAGYNISDDTSCGFAKTGSANNGDGVNPLLSPAGLADNGGPTQTIAPLAGSPAIDAIPLADCTDQASPPNPITTDQRGFKRPDAGEQVCDIGAYEFQDLFAGQPGAADYRSNSIAALAQQFGSLRAAAKALHFRRVKRLRRAVREFCAG